MTKRFSSVYNICLCQRCGCEFECWGGCPDVCSACEGEMLNPVSLDEYDGLIPDSDDDFLQVGEPDDLDGDE